MLTVEELPPEVDPADDFKVSSPFNILRISDGSSSVKIYCGKWGPCLWVGRVRGEMRDVWGVWSALKDVARRCGCCLVVWERGEGFSDRFARGVKAVGCKILWPNAWAKEIKDGK